MINIVHVDWRDECCGGAGLFSAVRGGEHGDPVVIMINIVHIDW